jgi:protein-L-isoaspartate(D-aspartate) O-methyltransferase
VSEALAAWLAREEITDGRVLEAIARLPRRLFVPPDVERFADEDRPLPIGHGQTISQPLLVAHMTQLLGLRGTERVLEVGTGSGWQAAILAALAREVWSIELDAELAERARALLLDRLGIANLRLRVGDGRRGWPEAAPFDRIVITAATAEVPPALLEQLAPGGRLLAPVGDPLGAQVLRLVEKGADGRVEARDLFPVRFVPLRPPPGS